MKSIAKIKDASLGSKPTETKLLNMVSFQPVKIKILINTPDNTYTVMAFAPKIMAIFVHFLYPSISTKNREAANVMEATPEVYMT